MSNKQQDDIDEHQKALGAQDFVRVSSKNETGIAESKTVLREHADKMYDDKLVKKPALSVNDLLKTIKDTFPENNSDLLSALPSKAFNYYKSAVLALAED